MYSRRLGEILEIAVTTSNGVAYSSGDQIGTVMEVVKASEDDRGILELKNIVVVDKEKQDKSLDIFFFDEQPTNAVADNSSADIAVAELIAKAIGCVNVPIAGYNDFATGSIATVRNVGLILKANKVADKSIWMLIVVRGTPTYTTTSGLMVKLGIERF